MVTTAAAPAISTPLHRALQFAALFALIKLALQVGATAWTVHLGYGYFRDEFYYILCGRNLDWGYVDHGPLVALQARLGLAIFGRSIVGIRMFAALAGAVKVFLTGLLAWSLGGRRPAQVLAMIAVIVAPVYLGIDSFLSMNSFEPVFWMACMLTVVLIVQGASLRWWLLVGLLSGLGLANKPSMTFYLVALLAALLVTPQRRVLFNRWFAAAVALTVLLCVPNLLWQQHHHWATWEFLRTDAVSGKNVHLGPAKFVLQQVQTLQPLNVLVWAAGLVWLLVNRRAREMRWIAVCYLLLLAIMIALHAKDYYLVPIYPVLFAAGGLAWEGSRPSVRRVSILAAVLIVTGAIISPMAIPLLRPEAWIRYTQALHLAGKMDKQETVDNGPLPQFYADRFGWQELTDKTAAIYDSLSPADRAKVGISTGNYGEASAMNFLGAPYHLPFAISGHNNYFLWGPHGYTGEVMIVINGATLDEMKQFYKSVEIAGKTDHPYSMPYERQNIYLARGRRANLTHDWPDFKHYD